MEQISIYVENSKYTNFEKASEIAEKLDWVSEEAIESSICSASYAALDLKKHLSIMLGSHASIVITSKFPISGKVIIVGTAADYYLKKMDFVSSVYEKMNEEAVYIKSCIIDGLECILLAGKSRRAHLYACSVYLSKLGVRWFSPGEKGTYIPKLKNLDFDNVDNIDAPKFTTRGCYSTFIKDDNPEFLDWMMHNKLNFAFMREIDHPWELKKRGISICNGGHVVLYKFLNPTDEYPYNHIYSVDKNKPKDPYQFSSKAIKPNKNKALTYYMAHPEWYGYIDGKRSSDVGEGNREGFGDNICTSNKDAIKELCKNIIESLECGWLKNVDYLNFWMLDNGRWCECITCKNSGNYTYRIVKIVYEIDKCIKKAQRNNIIKRKIKIMFPAYHETLDTPDRKLPKDFDYSTCIAIYFPIERCYVHNLDDVNCTETNTHLMKHLKAWTCGDERTYKGELFIGEYYNVSAFAQMNVCFTDIIRKEIPMYYSYGVRHLYYMHMYPSSWGSNTLLNYQLYSMLWNPNLDVDKLLSEFYILYYKDVSSIMIKYYKKLELASKNMKYFKHYQYSFDNYGNGVKTSLFMALNNGSQEENQLFPLKHMKYDIKLDDSNAGESMVATVKIIRQCRTILDNAIMMNEDNTVSKILEEEDMRFTYTYNMIMFLYYMTRNRILKGKNNIVLAKNEFLKAKMYAEVLKSTQFPTKDFTNKDLFGNGLKCTWAQRAYMQDKDFYNL